MSSRPDQAWNHAWSNPPPQSPDFSPPQHYPYAQTFDQRLLSPPYSHTENPPMPDLSGFMPPFPSDVSRPPSFQFDNTFQTQWTCPPQQANSYYASPPRPPVPLRQEYRSTDMNGIDSTDRFDLSIPHGFGASMRSMPGHGFPQHGAFGSHLVPNHGVPRRNPPTMNNIHPQTPRYPTQAPPPASEAGMTDRARLMHLHNRRHSQQESHHRPFNPPEYRTPTGFNGQGRRSDRSISPRTSATRRNYDRFSHDPTPSITSSDAEEATARLPPFSRARHRPREPRPRFYMPPQLMDPNFVSPKQIHDLKSKLLRRLPSELPEDSPSHCDICQKDYSNTHVQASEEQEIAVELPCGHVFGEFCISHWFDTCVKHKNKVTCPMCRLVLIETPRVHPAMAYARSSIAWQEALRADLALQSG